MLRLVLFALTMAVSAQPLAALQAQDSSAAESSAQPALVPAPEDDLPVARLTREGPDVLWDAMRVGEFSLLDQEGRTVTLETLRGKPWLANFIFTRCALECPLLLRNTFELNKRLQDLDLRIVTITVDPKYDDVDRMKKQSKVFDVDPDRWLFLTGPPDDVYDLIRKGFKQAAWENVGTDARPGMEFAHSRNMIHVNAEGEIVGKYDGHKQADIESLIAVLQGRAETPRANRPVAITTAPPAKERPRDGAAPGQLPEWAQRLPVTNAMLNTLATILLLGGYSAIKSQNRELHAKLMLFAFGTSVLFLGSYLTYHWQLQHHTGQSGRPFDGVGWIRPAYFGILISHIVLAVVVALAVPAVLVLALREKWTLHRRLARIVYPIWLYVSITGVVIYFLLYHLPPGLRQAAAG
ncbi:MAG: DUF420 domain-containing protein [Planctomyces sp.]|nr:DUF420 domain-containing protein [Planctomyces sp.]